MTKGNGMRIKSCLLAAVCLGFALAHAPAFAADSDSAKQDAGKISNQPAERSVSQTSSSGGDGAGAADTKTGDDIDLRITVQPHRPAPKGNKAAETKPKFTIPGVKNAHRRVFSASLAVNRAARNAINAPLVGSQIDLRHGSEQTTIHGPAGTNIGAAPALGLARTEPVIRPPIAQPHVTTIVVPNTANHASISGTGIGHRTANSPAGLGGPAKTLAGINGTSVRPAH